MEKVIYALWRGGVEDADQFAARMKASLMPTLLEAGSRGLQMNFRDSGGARGAGVEVIAASPPPDAIIQLWVDSAVPGPLEPFDRLIAAHCARHTGYLVTESHPDRNTKYPPRLGERTAGIAQIVFMKRPPRLTPEAWLDYWHTHHTADAMAMQNHFSYCQNVIARPVTFAAPSYDAIVEACYGEEIVDDLRYRFHGSTLAEREKTAAVYLEKTGNLVDFDKIDVLATSQYVYRTTGL